MSDKAKRTSFLLGDILLDGFKIGDEYFLSQSQVAEVVGVHSFLVSRFYDELRENQGFSISQNEGVNHIKALQGKDFKFHKIAIENNENGRGGRGQIVAVPPKIASLFWGHQARRGNNKALALVCACAEEALERRLDKAFEQVKTEPEYDTQLASNFEKMCSKLSWDEIRGFTESIHGRFQQWCEENCIPAGFIHNKITVAVCGKTAEELRGEELVTGNVKVGLNHIEDKRVLMKVAQVKLKIPAYRNGTPDQRIERAIKEITEIKKQKGRKQKATNN